MLLVTGCSNRLSYQFRLPLGLRTASLGYHSMLRGKFRKSHVAALCEQGGSSAEFAGPDRPVRLQGKHTGNAHADTGEPGSE